MNGPSVHDQLRQSTSVPSTPVTPGSCLTPDTPMDPPQTPIEQAAAAVESAPTAVEPQRITSARSSANSLCDLEVHHYDPMMALHSGS